MHAVGLLGGARRIMDFSDTYVGASGATSAGICALGVFLYLLLLSCIDHQIRAAGATSTNGGSWASPSGLTTSQAAELALLQVRAEIGVLKRAYPALC